MKIKLSIIGALESLLAVCLILDGNTVFHSATDFDLHLPMVCAFLCFLLAVICTVQEKGLVFKNDISLVVGLVVYYFVYFILKSSSIVKEDFLFTFILGLPLLLLYFRVMQRIGRVNNIFYKIENIVLVIAAVSLIIWLFGCIFNIIQPNTEINVFWGIQQRPVGYYGLLYVMTRDSTFGTGLIQNNAFFTEAPMLNIWLAIALGTEVFLKERYSKVKIVLLILCTISTISTTAFLSLFLLMFLKYCHDNYKTKSRNRLIMMGLLLVLIPVGISVIADIIAIKSSTQSFAIRMANYAVALKLFAEYPLLGSGYGNVSIFGLAQYKTTRRNLGFSNSIGSILGTGGVWMTLPYLVGIIIPFIKKYENKAGTVCFNIIYVFISVTTIFNARFLQALLIAYGLSFWAQSNIIAD